MAILQIFNVFILHTYYFFFIVNSTFCMPRL